MNLLVTEIEREFIYENDKGKKIPLDDIDSSMDPKDVVSFHSNAYPELTTATMKIDNKGDKIIYRLSTKMGTKG